MVNRRYSSTIKSLTKLFQTKIKKSTEELAVMIDPFRPVMITEDAMNLQVDNYYKSWIVD